MASSLSRGLCLAIYLFEYVFIVLNRLSFNLTGDFLNDNLSKAKPKNVIKLSEERAQRAKQDKDIFYRSLNRNLREEEIYIQG